MAHCGSGSDAMTPGGWIGRRVRVVSGPHAGTLGRVISEANPVRTAGPLVVQPEGRSDLAIFLAPDDLVAIEVPADPPRGDAR